jgi:hypothetical protein
VSGDLSCANWTRPVDIRLCVRRIRDDDRKVEEMRYMLMICTDETAEQALSSAEDSAMVEEYTGFTGEMRRRDVLEAGERLRPTTDATTVRVQNGDRLTFDGPFAETKEQIGGYFIVDCKDLDEAIEVAAKIPAARRGAIEVRPIWET